MSCPFLATCSIVSKPCDREGDPVSISAYSMSIIYIYIYIYYPPEHQMSHIPAIACLVGQGNVTSEEQNSLHAW